MAKVQIKSEKLTPFGGIFSIMEQFDALLAQTIDSTLGLRCTMFGYQYSEILRSLMCVYLCGGSCIEDVTTHLMKHLSLHPTLRTCSADTILRAIEELTFKSITYKSASGKSYDFNTADKMNCLLVNALLATGQLKSGQEYDFDFDHQFIETEKYDAKPTYKKFLGYSPGVAVINDMIVGIENRDGNTNVRFNQKETLERIFKRLEASEIYISRARMDCGSCSEEIVDMVEAHCRHFYIRANRCSSFYDSMFALTGWKTVVRYKCNPLILKKCMKIKMILIALTALLSLASCGDDDSGIQLTQDEIIGDINTGKKIVITSLTTYTESSSKVNVNGAKGKISATSSDESIAKVSCSTNEAEKEIYVSGVSVGNTSITITDSDGNIAVLKVEVKDWTTLWELSRTMYVVDRKCFVEGVSSEDSATIAADAIEKDSYNKYYTIRTRVYIPSGPYATKRLTITDDKGNVRMDGILKIQPNADNSEVWHLLPIGNYTEVVLATFYYDQKCIVKDVTGYYKTAYPKIKKVELHAIYAVEELEPDK